MRAVSKFAVVAAALMVATPGVAATFTTNGTGFAIPDAGAGNVPNSASSTVAVGALGTINSVTVSLNDFNHTWAGDLTATLSNGATTVSLFNRLGVPASPVGSSANFGGTYTFTDAAASFLPEISAGTNTIVPVGSYRPEQALSAFAGQGTAGNWLLTITDSAVVDTGTLRSWTLNIDYNNGAVPEPATWAMLICGFALVGAGMRRRSKVNVAYA